MRPFITALIFVLTATGACAQLVFERTQVVLEAGLLDEQLEAVFTFVNQGKSPVRITGVDSSCGCTVPQLSKNQFAPGESGEIRAVFTVGARVGPQTKRITVSTDQPNTPPIHLSLTTDIPEWVTVEPRILRWKEGAIPSAQTVRLKLANPTAVKVLAPERPLRHFDLRMEPVASDEYLLTLAPLTLNGRATEFIELKATVTINGESRTRPFGIHCLVR